MNQELTMVKFAVDRFFNPATVVSANIYKKTNPGNEQSEGRPFDEIRVAIQTGEKDHQTGKNLTLFSDVMETKEVAEAYILSGCNLK